MRTEYQELYKRQKRKALEYALMMFDGSQVKLARATNTNPTDITKWLRYGQLPRRVARLLGAMPSFPLTKEEIRPDIKIWD